MATKDNFNIHITIPRPVGHERNDIYLSIFTRADRGARTYVQTPLNGPKWDEVVRRVTFDLDAKHIIRSIQVKDQPTGCDLGLPFAFRGHQHQY